MERMALTVFSIGHLVSIIAVEGVIYSPCDAFFSTMDVARVALILDLIGPMGVNDEGVAIILDLLDQMHGLRHALQSVTSVTVYAPCGTRV